MEVQWHADALPLRQLIDSLLRQNSAFGTRFAPVRIFLAFAERDPVGGERALADLAENTYGPDAIRYPRAFGKGLFARLKGDVSAAQTSFATARTEQQKVVDAQPDYGPALCVLAFIDVGLGRKDDALREGRRAVELTSPSRDSVNAPHVMGIFAMTCAWVGEKDLESTG